MLNIVLVEPEIPQNTGNIVRTAAATGCRLHLVRPLGFDISDRALKRAGLDYWSYADFTVWDSLGEFLAGAAPGRALGTPPAAAIAEGSPAFYFLSTKGSRAYIEARFSDGDYLVFGKETLAANYRNTIRIPMRPGLRSLNLSNSVAVVVYEALRQLGFPGLSSEGSLCGGK